MAYSPLDNVMAPRPQSPQALQARQQMMAAPRPSGPQPMPMRGRPMPMMGNGGAYGSMPMRGPVADGGGFSPTPYPAPSGRLPVWNQGQANDNFVHMMPSTPGPFPGPMRGTPIPPMPMPPQGGGPRPQMGQVMPSFANAYGQAPSYGGGYGMQSLPMQGPGPSQFQPNFMGMNWGGGQQYQTYAPQDRFSRA